MHAIFFEPPIESNFLGHQMAEIYRDGVYAPFLLGKKDLTILDIGANLGLTSYYFSQFAKQVYAVEPSAEHLTVLNKMIKHNKLTNIKVIPKAIFMNSGKFPLFHNKNKTMYSLHMAVDDKSSEKEEIEAITLEDLFEQEKIEKVDLMKLDVEGSEVEILSHPTFKKVAPKIDTIVVERHQWSGRHPNQLVDALRLAGYQVNQIPNNADLLVAQRR